MKLLTFLFLLSFACCGQKLVYNTDLKKGNANQWIYIDGKNEKYRDSIGTGAVEYGNDSLWFRDGTGGTVWRKHKNQRNENPHHNNGAFYEEPNLGYGIDTSWQVFPARSSTAIEWLKKK